MSGAPIPIPVPADKILCIADLERAGSLKLTATARGMCGAIDITFLVPLAVGPMLTTGQSSLTRAPLIESASAKMPQRTISIE